MWKIKLVKKQVLMFAKVSTEKVGSTECQAFWKSKSEVLRFTKLSAEKGSSDDCHAIEKAKSKRTEEMELA
jgi:hypothetical protein